MEITERIFGVLSSTVAGNVRGCEEIGSLLKLNLLK